MARKRFGSGEEVLGPMAGLADVFAIIPRIVPGQDGRDDRNGTVCQKPFYGSAVWPAPPFYQSSATCWRVQMMVGALVVTYALSLSLANALKSLPDTAFQSPIVTVVHGLFVPGMLQSAPPNHAPNYARAPLIDDMA